MSDANPRSSDDPSSGARGERAPYPRTMEVSLESRCNARCLFCSTYNPSRRARPPLAVTDQVWSTLTREVVPHLETLGWTCNHEGMLSERFMSLLRDPAPQPVISIQTNGLLLKKRLDDLLAARKQVNLGVSLNAATPRTHSLLFGCSENRLGEIVTALRTLVARRRGAGAHLFLHLTFVAMKANLRELVAFARLASDIGVDSVVIKPLWWGLGIQWQAERHGYIFDYDQESVWRHDLAYRTQLDRAVEHLTAAGFGRDQLDIESTTSPSTAQRLIKTALDRAGFFRLVGRRVREPSDLEPLLRWTGPALLALRSRRPTDVVCDNPWRQAVVDERGNLQCCIFHSFYAGNLRGRSFIDGWNGWRLRQLRRTMLDGRVPAVCASCGRYA